MDANHRVQLSIGGRRLGLGLTMDRKESGNEKDAVASNSSSKPVPVSTKIILGEESTISNGDEGKTVKRVSFQDVRLESLYSKPTPIASGQIRMSAPDNRGKRVVRKTCVAKSTNQTNNKPFRSDHRHPASNDAVDVECCSVYARPELNTALQLAEQIQTLEMECFDGDAAVDRRLADCPATRRKLEAVSLCPLNFGRHDEIYSGVLHLSFDEEAVLRAAAEERDAKARAVLPAPRPRDPEPRLDDYLAEDAVQPEVVRFPAFRIDDLGFGEPEVAPRSAAYNLYRHQRMWRGQFQ